jgi:ABC-type glutathione transport system ATPase component
MPSSRAPDFIRLRAKDWIWRSNRFSLISGESIRSRVSVGLNAVGESNTLVTSAIRSLSHFEPSPIPRSSQLMQLVIEKLTKTYPNGVRALDSVSMTIPTGMYGLLGPNGVGKSTLMRTIATLQEPDSGSITLDDLDVLSEKTRVRQRLGYLPQEFGVYPKTSARAMHDHIAVLKGITNRGQRPDIVDAMLSRGNLQQHAQ